MPVFVNGDEVESVTIGKSGGSSDKIVKFIQSDEGEIKSIGGVIICDSFPVKKGDYIYLFECSLYSIECHKGTTQDICKTFNFEITEEQVLQIANNSVDLENIPQNVWRG